MKEKLPFWPRRRLQAPKCWFLAPSGARNQHFENSRLEFPENPNLIGGKLAETNQKSANKSQKNAGYSPFGAGYPSSCLAAVSES